MLKKINYLLLVDDDTIANFLLKVLIEELEVIERYDFLSSGADALDYVEKICNGNKCPDLILLDLKMPVMDGYEFLEAYKELFFKEKSKIKIIVLSSSSHKRDIDRVMELGAVDYVIKPITKEKLRIVLDKHFQILLD